MTKLAKTSTFLAAAIAVAAPVAAQAGTRAESSPVTIDVQRGSAGAVDQSEIGAFNPVWLLLLLAAVAALVAVASGGRSRGG